MDHSPVIEYDDAQRLFWRNNRCPSPAQESAIESLYRSMENDIRTLEHQISKTTSNPLDLQEEHTQIQYRLEVCRSFLSSARLLPSEILLIIFMYAIPSCTPATICRVSLAWREAMLSCPTLYGSTSKYRAYGFIKRADTTFHFFLKTASDVDIKSLSILKGIAPYYNYISKLTLKMHAADYIEFMTLPAGSISLLETLVILVVSGWDYGDPRGPETIFEGGAPRLRKLVFYSGDRTRLAPQLMVPWNQLTHVIINDSSSSLSLVTDNLIQITQVEFASLKGYVRGGLPVPHQTITFPKLMHLRLGLKVERESRAITMWIRWIQKLRFPALQTLDIHGGGVGTRLRYLLPSVSPCLSLLRRLSFENIRATARELAEMLICCTSLEHLVLCIKKRDGIDADTALCALQTVLTSSSLMPSPNPEDWKPSTAALSTLRALMLTFEDFDEGGSPHEILHRYQALLISWMQHPMYKNALQAITLIIYEPEELDAYGTLPHWQDVIDDLEACAKENYDEGMEPEIVVEALMRRVGNNWFDYASF